MALLDGLKYLIMQGPQKFEWFLSLVDITMTSNHRYLFLEISDQSTVKQNLRLSLVTLTKITSSQADWDNDTWDISQVEGLGPHDNWRGHEWYFIADTPMGMVHGIYSTQTRKGILFTYNRPSKL